MTWRRASAALVLSLAVVAATNRDGGTPNRQSAPADAYSYWALAAAAPALPDEVLLFHHVQRIALPFALGLLHDATGVPLHTLFQSAVVLLAAGILALAALALRDRGVHPAAAALVGAALACNPWVFRPSFAFPEMVSDLGFVFGLAIAMHGLLGGHATPVLIGQLVASASRQTGVVLVPVIALWMWRDRTRWARVPGATRLAAVLAAAVVAAAIYLATWQIAIPIAAPPENVAHLTGIAPWLATAFDPAVFGAFAVRALLPLVIPLGIVVLATRSPWAQGSESGAVPLLLVASLCLGLQPVLAGPEFTGGNGPRLVALGLLPLYLAAGLALHDARAFTSATTTPRLAVVGLLLAVGSLHHWYVLTATPSRLQQGFFAVAYAAGCAGTLALVTSELRAARR